MNMNYETGSKVENEKTVWQVGGKDIGHILSGITG